VTFALVDIYAKIESTAKVRELLDGMPQGSATIKNVMITRYAQNGSIKKKAFKTNTTT